jgi:DNA primase
MKTREAAVMESPFIINATDAVPPPYSVPPETASLLLERVSGIYAGRFAEAIEGRACLERHGLTNAALLDRHRVGYCDGTLADLLPKEGPLKEELKALGILLNNGQERFLGCVVYPLYNPDGQLASMVAHAAADGPLHYRILPGRPQGLWNTAALKTYSEIILAPSPLDGLSVMTSGHANVTALCGTLELGEQHLALFKKHGIQKIILLPAGGKACPNASRLIQQLQAEGINSTVRMLPEGRDPNSFLLAHGPAKLAAFLAVRDTSSPPVGQPHLQPAERMAL